MSKENQQTKIPGAEAAAQDANFLFPVFLRLEVLEVLLVGAGKVGLEKLTAILNNSPQAKVSVVATKVLEEVRTLAENYQFVSIEERSFEEADLDGKDLVVLAIDDKEASKTIRDLARERKILVNAADKPDQCDFYLSSVVQKGNLKIAISTNGKKPSKFTQTKRSTTQYSRNLSINPGFLRTNKSTNKIDFNRQTSTTV